MEKLRAFIQLIRPYGIFIALMPLLGAISNGIFENFLILFLIGIFANFFGFVQNDYFDIEIDKKSEYVSNRPLASGRISKNEAIFIMLLFFISPILLSLFLSFYSLIFLILYFSFYTLYNKFSKKYAFMEYSLGLAGTMIFLSGAFSSTEKISILCFMLSLLPIFKYAFNVGISANLKDIKYDLMQGIKTTPTIFGVFVNEKVHIPKNFILYGYSLKIFFIFLSLIALCYFFSSIFSILLFISISFLILYTMTKIFENIENRKKMLFYAEIHEIATYMLIVSILYDYIAIYYSPLLSFAMLILPPIWILTCIKFFFMGKPLE